MSTPSRSSLYLLPPMTDEEKHELFHGTVRVQRGARGCLSFVVTTPHVSHPGPQEVYRFVLTKEHLRDIATLRPSSGLCVAPEADVAHLKEGTSMLLTKADETKVIAKTASIAKKRRRALSAQTQQRNRRHDDELADLPSFKRPRVDPPTNTPSTGPKEILVE